MIHPVLLGQRVMSGRRLGGELAGVRVFRGRPNPERRATLTAANDAQAAEWGRDPRVAVIRRDLNYRGWPATPPQEKGVDVALAVDLIEMALIGRYDVGVVFSCDTDLLPAIEVAFRRTPLQVEVACWRGARPLWFPQELAAQPRRYLPYCTFSTRGTSPTFVTALSRRGSVGGGIHASWDGAGAGGEQGADVEEARPIEVGADDAPTRRTMERTATPDPGRCATSRPLRQARSAAARAAAARNTPARRSRPDGPEC